MSTTLYYAPGACSLAPHIVLEWIGAPYEAVKVKFGSPELLAVNPTGAVPALKEDDGWLLTQAGAILDYLSNKHPEANLSGGKSVKERGKAQQWSSFFGADVHPAFWPVYFPQRYTTDPSEEAKKKVLEAAHSMIRKRFDVLDKHLAGREWIVGEGKGVRSVVDAYAFPMIRWADKILEGGISSWPNVKALHDRLEADPAVQRVLAREAGK
ncbi:glutathione S-transferase family protein [Swingsia samuiensis]|uniref:Glutathione S-transferase family protein n=1 Tax=Swingsia samuiensis TaxID=1293412 RepID=A0A4Y6UJ80_9PROT|nr:glutathione S-transferase family protein [Swingsia samuiensis]QDH16526.1 glutathione S-transferase family protein [Swingsia samuiensis]